MIKTTKLVAKSESELKSYLAKVTESDKWVQYTANLAKGIHNTTYLGQIVIEHTAPDEPILSETFHADIHHTEDAELPPLPDGFEVHEPNNPIHNFWTP